MKSSYIWVKILQNIKKQPFTTKDILINTDLSQPSIVRGLKHLENLNLIKKSKVNNRKNEYTTTKDYDTHKPLIMKLK